MYTRYVMLPVALPYSYRIVSLSAATNSRSIRSRIRIFKSQIS